MTCGIYSLRNEPRDLSFIDESRIFHYEFGQEQDFFNANHRHKIAVLEPNYQNFASLADMLTMFEHCDAIIVYSLELNDTIYDILVNFDRPNFTFIVNGVLDTNLKHAQFITALPWFTSTANYYFDNLHELLKAKLNPFKPKPSCFDVMYGRARPNRQFVFQQLVNASQQDFYQTPFFDTNKNDSISKYNLAHADLWEDEVIPLPADDYFCEYFGNKMYISQVLPFKIYNKTSYSLVCETMDERLGFSFFTEKTLKPILAHRLFIPIAARNFLKNLRSIGFKTFHGIVDESFDSIENDKQRWTQALNQAKWLCTQDQTSIFKKLVPIVLHNYNVLKRLDTTAIIQALDSELLSRGYFK